MIIDCEFVIGFVLDSVTGSASIISVNINSILMLNGTNFKNWKDNILIVLGCMDLDLALREEQPTPFSEKSSIDNKVNMEK